MAWRLGVDRICGRDFSCCPLYLVLIISRLILLVYIDWFRGKFHFGEYPMTSSLFQLAISASKPQEFTFLLWPVWPSWLACHHMHWKVTGLIPSLGTYLDCGFNFQSRCNWSMFFSHICFSLPHPTSSFSKNQWIRHWVRIYLKSSAFCRVSLLINLKWNPFPKDPRLVVPSCGLASLEKCSSLPVHPGLSPSLSVFILLSHEIEPSLLCLPGVLNLL